MSAVMQEPLALEVMFVETDTQIDTETREQIEGEVKAQNRAASEVAAESLEAFLDLLSAADADYIDAGDYAPVPAPEPGTLVDWESVSQALSESQAILIGVQQLLSETLAAMGLEDHQFIRVYADDAGSLRLVSDHDRREEIETTLNGPENQNLRNLYQAAVSGMSLAGGLIGAMSVPQEVLEQIKAKKQHAA